MRTMGACMIFLAFLFPEVVFGNGMDHSCLNSMPVKSESKVTIGGETLSCTALEEYRGNLFRKVDALEAAKSKQTSARASLIQMESQLRKIEGAESGSVVQDVTGSFLATIGLASCLETVAGCVVAGISKAMQIFQTLSTKSDEVARREAVRELRELLENSRRKIDATKEDELENAVRLSVAQFNQLCVAIRSSCN